MNYRVLQFGGGNFIRAFFDWMLQKIEESTGQKQEVFLVKATPGKGRVLALPREYSVLLRGRREGEYRERLDAVTVIKGGCDPYTPQGFNELMEAALSPDLRVVTSNTTEAGIFFEEREGPHNFPSFLAAALEKRAAAGLPPLFILPLELIEDNGRVLKNCLERYGRQWGYGGCFFDYLDDCYFYDTLVDRIVTGFPPREAEKIASKRGRMDPFLVAGELFHLLVLQGDERILEVLPFHQGGLNAVVTKDGLPFYRDRKVRVLNGVHTASTPLALSAGVEFVKAFVEDGRFGPLLKKLIRDEIIPAFSDDPETYEYGDEVLERFKNPALEHSFRAIALNSISKMNARLRPTLEDYFKKFKTLPPLLTGAVAAMAELYDCDGAKDLPGGPLELADFHQLKGPGLEGAMDSFFPGLDGALRQALLSRVGAINSAQAAGSNPWRC